MWLAVGVIIAAVIFFTALILINCVRARKLRAAGIHGPSQLHPQASVNPFQAPGHSHQRTQAPRPYRPPASQYNQASDVSHDPEHPSLLDDEPLPRYEPPATPPPCFETSIHEPPKPPNVYDPINPANMNEAQNQVH